MIVSVPSEALSSCIVTVMCVRLLPGGNTRVFEPDGEYSEGSMYAWTKEYDYIPSNLVSGECLPSQEYDYLIW